MTKTTENKYRAAADSVFQTILAEPNSVKQKQMAFHLIEIARTGPSDPIRHAEALGASAAFFNALHGYPPHKANQQWQHSRLNIRQNFATLTNTEREQVERQIIPWHSGEKHA